MRTTYKTLYSVHLIYVARLYGVLPCSAYPWHSSRHFDYLYSVFFEQEARSELWEGNRARAASSCTCETKRSRHSFQKLSVAVTLLHHMAICLHQR